MHEYSTNSLLFYFKISVFLPLIILLSISLELGGPGVPGHQGSLHPISHYYYFLQIQTSKTQELNMLREQTTELAAELQHRQAEYEDLMGQKDDLNSQLQVMLLT